MKLNEALNKFLEVEMERTQLTSIDLAHLRVGFLKGVEYQVLEQIRSIDVETAEKVEGLLK